MKRILQIERAAFAGEAYSRDMFLELYESCADLFFVARRGGRLVGYMVTCAQSQQAEIVSIAVDPQYREMGAGRALMRHTLGKLKNSGVVAVELMVRPANTPAVRFYRRFGFSRVGKVARYYADGGDGLHMRKRLNS